jgi:hypothetical protein
MNYLKLHPSHFSGPLKASLRWVGCSQDSLSAYLRKF